MQGSLTTRRNIYRAISALMFSSFKIKASSEALKIKNEGRGEARKMCNPHKRFFRESSLLG